MDIRRGFLPVTARTKVLDSTLTLLDRGAAEAILPLAALRYRLLVGITRRLALSSLLPAFLLDNAHRRRCREYEERTYESYRKQ